MSAKIISVLTQVITLAVAKLPHEETRKIIRVGNSYAVTIPKPWLKYYNLTDKDKVTVLSNGNIIIEPKRSQE